MSDYVRRRAAQAKVDTALQTAPTGEWSDWYPALAEWLTLSVLDGKPRNTATILVFTEGPVWKCRFLDREANEQVFVSGRTLQELLQALENGLVQGGMDWRPVKDWGQGRPGKKV